MSRPLLVFLFSLLMPVSIWGQKVIYNFDIHQDWPHFEELGTLWRNFLSAKSDSAASQYWNQHEVQRYGQENYFLINNEYNPPLRQMAQAYRVQILQISRHDSLYKISSQLYYPHGDTLMTLCIIEVYAREDKSGTFKLQNAGPIHLRENWQSRELGYLRYHFPSYHQFDLSKAQMQNHFISDTLPRIFGVQPDTVDYYFAPRQQEMNAMRGFVFKVGHSGTEKPGGKAVRANKSVYTTGTGEYYPHELMHIFVDPLFPNRHNWASEGLATYLGGSRGKSLLWHIERSHRYLAAHPEIDLSNMLDLLTMDEYTDYRYVLGGTIILLIHEKQGWQGVKEFLNTGSTAADYYRGIAEQLGWRRSQIDKKLRRELARLAENN